MQNTHLKLSNGWTVSLLTSLPQAGPSPVLEVWAWLDMPEGQDQVIFEREPRRITADELPGYILMVSDRAPLSA